jgi:hypothetical protein
MGATVFSRAQDGANHGRSTSGVLLMAFIYRRFLTAAAVLAMLLPGIALLRAEQGTASPDLTGTWVLNAQLSDHGGQAAPDGGNGGGRRRGGGMGGPGGGMGGMGGGMGRRGGFGGGGGAPDQEDMERRRAAMDAAMRRPARLIIVKGESGLIVTDEDGITTRLPLDGKKDTGAAEGVPFETTTKWEDGKLRVERKFKGGLKVVEYYALSSEPPLLTISSKIEGGRGPGRTSTRVYEHAPAPGF